MFFYSFYFRALEIKPFFPDYHHLKGMCRPRASHQLFVCKFILSFYKYAKQERKFKEIIPWLINQAGKVVATDEKTGVLNNFLPQSSLATSLPFITQVDKLPDMERAALPPTPIRERGSEIPDHLRNMKTCITCVEFSKLWKNTETHQNII